MKKNSFYKMNSKIWLLLFSGFLCTSLNLMAQEETISSRMRVEVTQLYPDSISIEGLCRARIDRRYVGLPGLTLTFLNLNDTIEKEIGNLTTDQNGKVRTKIANDQLIFNPDSSFTIICRFEGNDQYEESEDEVTLYEARIEVEPNNEDSIKTLGIHMVNYKDQPVAEEDIIVYVKRLFSLLPIGEGSTDEEGHCNVEIPTDLPGDPSGVLHFLVKLEDHSDYGTLINEFDLDWGLPISNDNLDQQRTLWTPYPPWWMLVTFLVLMGVVWGHYVLLVTKLFKIKKLGS